MSKVRGHHGISYIKWEKKKYKYKLVKPYNLQTKLTRNPKVGNDYVTLDPEGMLKISSNYAWDGPSGPTIDTKNFMRGSLVHDALYQLMRERHLDYKKERKYADRLLRKICREDGMSAFRAWSVYHSVRIFSKSYAKPKN